MPAHIDIRRGKYALVILANQRAIIADSIWGAEGEVAYRRGVSMKKPMIYRR